MKHAKDYFVSREHYYALGVDEDTGRHYLSIPVDNGRVSYEEYYEIDEETYSRYMADPEAALAFAERCRNREVDDALIYQPSKVRGEPYRPKASP
ncbi:MAG: hypothetical protein ACRD2Z_11930 [Thermoanaerobaculia bacterium]